MNSVRPDDKLEAGVSEAVRHEEPPLPSGSEPELLQPQFKPSVYQWSVRLFTLVRRMLGVNIKLHGPVDWIRQGDIFLFNHFARFETFIPQYLIHIETGDYCRSVASHEFFAGQDRFANYLLNVGPLQCARRIVLERDVLAQRRATAATPQRRGGAGAVAGAVQA